MCRLWEEDPVAGLYRIHDFAGMAGVSVKTLHHYDRLGLLTARRTATGYRRYALTDLVRLEAIIALRAVGFALRDIRVLLEATAGGANESTGEGRLLDKLARQREVLGERRRRLTSAIEAIENIEADTQRRTLSDRHVLRRLVGELRAGNDMNDGERYADAVWAEVEAERQRRASHVERAPDRVSQSRRTLFREIAAALEQDASGRTARPHVERWESLMARETGGDLEMMREMKAAWSSRPHWPPGLKRYVSSLYEMELDTWEAVATCIEQSTHP